MSKSTNKNTIIIALVVGYLLGAFIGFGGGGKTTASYAGTYTTTTWNGHNASLVLNADGTCKLPSQYPPDAPCSYVVKDGYVYFNGEATSDTAIGETGLVYKENNFTKLK